jgi:hypothetical protein
MFLRECWSEDQIESVLSWLRHQNARGAHIYVRPSGAHEPSLIDDLSAEAITRMKDRISARPRRGDLTSQLSGLAQSRTNARSENQYLGRKGTREAVRWRSLERGLEAFRSTRRLHESEARKALAERVGSVRTPASVPGKDLRRGRRICRRSKITRREGCGRACGAEDISVDVE